MVVIWGVRAYPMNSDPMNPMNPMMNEFLSIDDISGEVKCQQSANIVKNKVLQVLAGYGGSYFRHDKKPNSLWAF